MAAIYNLLTFQVEGMSEKIKILYTIPNFDTAGSGKALLKIAQRLDTTRFEPHICCFHDKGEFFDTVRASGIPVHLYTYTTPMIPRVKGLRNTWRISRFLKQGKFDLIHSFHYADDYSEGLAARMAGIRWVFTKKNMNWGANSWKIRSKIASGIIAQNTDMIKNFFPGRSNVALVGRGVDTSEFKPLPRTEGLIREFNLPPQAKVILMVANLVPVKGAEVLLEAFNKVAGSFDHLYLFYVGDNQSDYGTEMKSLASRSPWCDQIIFTGKRLDVKDFHSIADMFVLPTLNKGRQEGSPVSLLEAMASGSFSLASNVAGIRDQLSNLPDQLFVPGDSQELASKLKKYLSCSQEQLKSLTDQQLREVKNRFTIEREVNDHENFYWRISGKQ